MLLETDAQTIEDLRIFSKRDIPGIFDIYNETHTRGGENLLRALFRQPCSDLESIKSRTAILSYFARNTLTFPFDASLFDLTEKYVGNRVGDSSAATSKLGDRDIENGVTAIIQLLWGLRSLMDTESMRQAVPYQGHREAICTILEDVAFEPVFKEKFTGKISYTAITAFDLLFRNRVYEKIEELLDKVYLLDVYLSVAHVASKRQLAFPQPYEKGSQILHVEGLYHPELKSPVCNDVAMDGESTLIFLTGANMAGKSTFLRAIGTAVYLAHMGFPVAAKSMAFSVMDGVYTTINLPDNLGIGASHFYAEVLRVKKIAAELHSRKSIFVIFDELFRGTNVKDAHEATVAVALAFAKKENCRFIISSHIVEAAEQLKIQKGVDFLYLPTRMEGTMPIYTYTLERGVTDDRHGMLIIRNEGILDILKNGKKRTSRSELMGENV